MNVIRNTNPDPLTIAMIAAGVSEALAAGCPINEIHDGEDDLMLDVVRHAHLFDAEWQRRYGKSGRQAPANLYLKVAKPFGAGFARLLARDPDAQPYCLMTSLFDAADTQASGDAASLMATLPEAA